MPPKVGKGKGGKAAKGGKGGKGGKDADPNDPEVLFARAASKLNQEKQNLVSSLLPVLSPATLSPAWSVPRRGPHATRRKPQTDEPVSAKGQTPVCVRRSRGQLTTLSSPTSRTSLRV